MSGISKLLNAYRASPTGNAIHMVTRTHEIGTLTGLFTVHLQTEKVGIARRGLGGEASRRWDGRGPRSNDASNVSMRRVWSIKEGPDNGHQLLPLLKDPSAHHAATGENHRHARADNVPPAHTPIEKAPLKHKMKTSLATQPLC